MDITKKLISSINRYDKMYDKNPEYFKGIITYILKTLLHEDLVYNEKYFNLWIDNMILVLISDDSKFISKIHIINCKNNECNCKIIKTIFMNISDNLTKSNKIMYENTFDTYLNILDKEQNKGINDPINYYREKSITMGIQLCIPIMLEILKLTEINYSKCYILLKFIEVEVIQINDYYSLSKEIKDNEEINNYNIKFRKNIEEWVFIKKTRNNYFKECVKDINPSEYVFYTWFIKLCDENLIWCCFTPRYNNDNEKYYKLSISKL